MKRLKDWPNRLEKWVESVDLKPFKWGEHDCMLAACDAVLAMTGVDMAADFRGEYSDEAGAKVILAEFHGGQVGDLASVYALSLELEPIEPLSARRGDILLFDWGKMQTLSVCVGKMGLCPGLKKAHYIAIDKATSAWRIG